MLRFHHYRPRRSLALHWKFVIATAESPRHFDPATRGTADAEWCAFLRRCEDWQPQPGPLVVVAPHPDDEILGAGGLIRAWSLSGLPVTVVSVTDGEAADERRPGLDLVRRDELRAALRKLSLRHVTVERLGIPDGKVLNHTNRLRNAVHLHATSGVTIVAPFERDGHPDHEAVGRVCLEIGMTYGISIVRYPVWTWHHTEPSTLAELRWGRFPLTLDSQRAKSRAIQCFDSQLRPPHGAPILPAHVLAYFARPYEAFVL